MKLIKVKCKDEQGWLESKVGRVEFSSVYVEGKFDYCVWLVFAVQGLGPSPARRGINGVTNENTVYFSKATADKLAKAYNGTATYMR